jgi:hypothetical protein
VKNYPVLLCSTCSGAKRALILQRKGSLAKNEATREVSRGMDLQGRRGKQTNQAEAQGKTLLRLSALAFTPLGSFALLSSRHTRWPAPKPPGKQGEGEHRGKQTTGGPVRMQLGLIPPGWPTKAGP